MMKTRKLNQPNSTVPEGQSTFILTRGDLRRPYVLLDAFQQLLEEVWRFAPVHEREYTRSLPFDYVCHRFMERMIHDRRSSAVIDDIVIALTIMAGEGCLIKSSQGNLVLP